MAGGVDVVIGGVTYSDTDNRVGPIQIDRGRQDELDRVETGTCSIELIYKSGSIPDLIGEEVAVFVLGGQRFGGVVHELKITPDPSQVVTRVQVECVDFMEIAARIELAPDAGFGDSSAGGNVHYAEETVQSRIEKAIDEAGLVGNEIFTGNVRVGGANGYTTYAPRTSLLTVINDAADAEFPGVANFYCPRTATSTAAFNFHGRLARFNPDDEQYHIATFKAGDRAACLGDSARAQIRELSLSESRDRIINAALATPEGIADDDIAGQVVTDAGSISSYGLRSWSAENLITVHDNLNDVGPNEATLLFAEYYVDNYAGLQRRIESLTFRSSDGRTLNNAANRDLISTIDISDILDLSMSNPALTVSAEYFVEGLHESIVPMNDSTPDITLTLDLSPRAFWTNNPFPVE